MDQNLKHRLTGAIILVSLAVIFIPVILEGPDNEWTPLSHGIPKPPELDYRARIDPSRPVEIPAPLDRAGTVAEKPAYRLAGPARKKTSVPVAQPAPAPAPAPQPQPGAEPEIAASEKPAAAIPDGWYVQVGSFSQELNASGLSKRLEMSGYTARFQRTTSGTGHIYRVLVGPDTSREQAEKLRDRLARELQLDAIVINSPG